MNKNTIQFFKPVTFLFIVITTLIFIFSSWLDAHEVNHSVLLSCQYYFIDIDFYNRFLTHKSSENSNPHAFVRSITLSAFIKLIVIAVAVFVIFKLSSENKSIYAVGVAMMLYVIYTVFEVEVPCV